MTKHPIIPFLLDTHTGAVRVSGQIEGRLSEMLQRPVRIHSKQNLAHALIAALHVTALNSVQAAAQQAQHYYADNPEDDGPAP